MPKENKNGKALSEENLDEVSGGHALFDFEIPRNDLSLGGGMGYREKMVTGPYNPPSEDTNPSIKI